MKLETILYIGGLLEIKPYLPEFVKNAELKRKFDDRCSIEINAENHQAVEYLDEELGEAISTGRCKRVNRIEIDKKEIPNYDYFYILPIPLEYGKYVFADVKMPRCSQKKLIFGEIHEMYDFCNVGSQLLSPVKVKKQKAEKLDIAVLNYPWEKEIVLLLSSRMKKIFDAEGITGLVYEPAQLIKAAHRIDYVRSNGISRMVYKEIPDDNPDIIETPYIARIPCTVYRHADKVFNEIQCETHFTIFATFDSFINSMVTYNEISDVGFFQVQGVCANGKTYNYKKNHFYISRKVLEILLNHDAKGLHRVGVFIKSKFAPMIEIRDN